MACEGNCRQPKIRQLFPLIKKERNLKAQFFTNIPESILRLIKMSLNISAVLHGSGLIDTFS